MANEPKNPNPSGSDLDDWSYSEDPQEGRINTPKDDCC